MSDLRARILAGERLVGTFVKTPSPQVVELLAKAGLDFGVADMEHAPIGRGALDLMAMAGRGAGLPLLIRSAGRAPEAIWPALDMGCAGVMTPHVDSAAAAGAVVDAVKYGNGKRGVSPSGRGGGYGRPADRHMEASDAESVVMVQIEEAWALENLDAIAAVEGVDVLFVGPLDLSLSMGVAMDGPELREAVARVAAAARRAGKAAGLFVGAAATVPGWAALGVSVFVCGSDQSMLVAAARAMKEGALAPGETEGT